MKTKSQHTATVLALAFMALPLAHGQETKPGDKKLGKVSSVIKEKLTKPSPYTKRNNSWITLSGKVTATTGNSFTLDYGKGAVVVEMDGWEWYKTGHALIKGDQVTVSGRVDRDKGESTSIEASSVYVKGFNTYFYANPTDEEDYIPEFLSITADPEMFELQGVVTKIDGREFTLTDASGSTIIDTKSLSYNPMDDEGFQKIKLNDIVRVYGKLDKGIFEADEIAASAIITLVKR